VTVAPDRKFVPDTLSICIGTPLYAVAGEIPVTEGAPLLTVNPFVRGELLFPSGLVTTTFHCPAAAPARLNVQVSCVEETNPTDIPVISGYPERVSRTVAPFWKLAPARLVMGTALPTIPDEGVMPVMDGAGADDVGGVDRVGAGPVPVFAKLADAIVYAPGTYMIRTVSGVPELIV